MRDRQLNLCARRQQQERDWKQTLRQTVPQEPVFYLADQTCYPLPNQQLLTPVSRYQGNASARAYVAYGTTACSDCPLQQNSRAAPPARTINGM